MKEPTQPAAWANLLVKAWGPDRFPVCVKTIAAEYSRRFSDPIIYIKEAPIDTFEGMLAPLKKRGGWAILYNPTIRSAGRINFTLAHEFGHYLVHRAAAPTGFQCSQGRVLGFDADARQKQIEREADTFASYLLMPIDDFRQQTERQEMTVELLRHCADRYGVSATAAALKWIEFTTDCAVLVVAVDGFVLWCRRSDAAKRSRLWFPPAMELPAGSVASRGLEAVVDPSRGSELAAGIWSPAQAVREMAIFADDYDMTISLLIFEKQDFRYVDPDEAELEDTFDRFTRSPH